MSENDEQIRNDLRQALITLFKETTIMEMRGFNDESSFRPTYKEVLYMYGISSKDNCTATDLVKMFNISKETMSIALSKMEKKGFIERTVDPEDNRRQIIVIADERFTELATQRLVYDEAKEKLLTKYTKEEFELASRIIFDLAEEMNNLDRLKINSKSS